MKNSISIYVSILVLVLISCNDQDFDIPIYPVKLTLIAIDYGGGITTYTSKGVVQSPLFEDWDLVNNIEKNLFAETITIKSDDFAQFTFVESFDCPADCIIELNKIMSDVKIDYRNDSIVFSFEYFNVGFEYTSKGDIRQKLEFPGYAYRHVDNVSTSYSMISARVIYGQKDFSSLLNNLEPNDSLSIVKFTSTYEN